MNQPITLRTLLVTNSLTILLLITILLVPSIFANPPEPSATLTSTTASTPSTISYQGHLTDGNGQPINTTTPMTFRLYTTSTGGTAVWTEERTGANAVPVTNGLFNVLLGSVTPIDTTLFNQALWLGISVNGDAEMIPREPFNALPYATVAGAVTDQALIRSLSDTGLKFQAGKIQHRNTGTVYQDVDVSFRTPFAEPPMVMITNCGSSGRNWGTVAWSVHDEPTTTGFKAHYNVGTEGSGSYQACWLAIGH